MATTHTEQDHSTRFYWIVGAILAVITIVEVLVTFVLGGIPLLIVLLVLSVIKGAAVVMFFMHLRGDARVFQFLFIAPFLMAVSMLLAFLAINSVHVGIGG
jgi:cytochrome c oxidase subunit 4/cytochrome o ubiquinol oxidase operon protein cyoD